MIRERADEKVGHTAHMADLMLSWRESPVLLAVCCDLGDVMRCALSSTSILSTMLQLTRCCLVFVRFCADAADARKNRGDCELSWSFELTMLASLSAEVLMLARCGVGGGGGASGWRS